MSFLAYSGLTLVIRERVANVITSQLPFKRDALKIFTAKRMYYASYKSIGDIRDVLLPFREGSKLSPNAYNYHDHGCSFGYPLNLD